MLKWVTNIITDSNEKVIKRLQPAVVEINELEPEMQRLSDEDLRAKTEEFRARLADGEELDDILAEAFAAVREASRRSIGLRHFDMQLIGGMVLHQGKISEMKTGEGKTLVATLALYLNALEGRGAHLVTVNDYLAKRDVQWMGPIYHVLGLTVSSIQHEAAFILDPSYNVDNPTMRHLRPISRREAYYADITYGTNNEFGFDYLRDNMVSALAQCVQRELHYAIVDEVDNILIDEARTPLIISAPAEESAQMYYTFARLVPRLHSGEDYTLDEKLRAVSLTEVGIAKVEKWLNVSNIYDPSNYMLTHYLDSALKANVLYKRDRDYMVKDGEVIIVDEFTGRLMFGRRYSEGLHQAIEAKEGVRIQRESVTLATITFQNYFRLYDKLAGMTGTAATEAEEFHKIYKLEVVVIPPNKTMIRQDSSDYVYKSEEAKFQAAAKEIEDLNKKDRPVLVGTVSIEKSEYLSDMLRRRGVPHQVLNAKYHEKEAAIVAEAGRVGAVTIATNMAGRGTDIILGGSPVERTPAEWEAEHKKVVDLGGLHILGTERHEARRIDNQLRGRAGRQGDPGSSRFYVSLEDDIMRRFGGDRIKGFMDWAGLEDDVPIENRLVSKSLESAQTKVEGYNFDIRKHLVEYDDVINVQRDKVYSERRKILEGADLKANILDMIHQEISGLAAMHLPERQNEGWDIEGLISDVGNIIPLEGLDVDALASLGHEEIEQALLEHADRLYEEHEVEVGTEKMRVLERLVMLQVIDSLWVEHLTAVDELRNVIGLRAYGQTDPLVAYKREAHDMYDALTDSIRRDIVRTIYHVTLGPATPAPALSRAMAMARTNRGGDSQPARNASGNKVGRNDPCPCGSGKKYKKCHGA